MQTVRAPYRSSAAQPELLGSIVAAIGVVLLAIAAQQADARSPSLELARDSGWQEALISTSDARRLESFFTSIAGWRVLWRGSAHASVAKLYGASGSPREWLIGDAAGHPGLVRLVEFDAPTAITIRGAAQPWDTGGILSLMTRSNDVHGVFQSAERAGWLAYNAPVDFDFGPINLRNVVLRGPDGVNISVYERVTPRMPPDPDLRKLRRPFNAMQSVRDIVAARRFYGDILGFELVNGGEFVNPRRAPNNFGMPANIVATHPIHFAIFAPRKDGPTAIEAVQLVGAEGRDLAAAALPPNRGIVSLRFPVSDLSRTEARLAAQGLAPAWPITVLELRPYGRVRLLGVRSPDGALLEFFQALDQP